MRRVIAVAAGAAAFAAVAAGCSSTSGSTSAAAPASTPAASGAPAPAAPAGGAATLKVAASADGQILVDGSGKTLYLFKADTGTTSTCNGACAVAWPPDTTTGTPNATGLTGAAVATSTRADKTTQVTVAGHPLYYFSHDTKAGDVNGQGITAFGGTWYVVGPDGAAVTGTAAPSQTPTTSGNGY